MPSDLPQREVVCPYCGLNAELVDSTRIYRKSYGMVWLCQPCEAWVGVHQDSKSNRPKGTLAKASLRKLRIETHQVFDAMWRRRVDAGLSRRKARTGAYRDLAIALQIDDDDCHIGMFDEARCREVIRICLKWQEAATEAAASDVIEE